MKSTATLLNLSTNLSNNTSAANQALMLQLMGDEQRYDLERYFDNEREYQATTLGGLSLTLTAQVDAGGTSATLSEAWPYQSCTQFINFTAPATAVTVTTTTSLSSGDTSATLSSAWAYTTAVINTTFSNGDVYAVSYTNGSTSITFEGALTSDATSTLTLASSTDQRSGVFTNGSTTLTWTGGLNGFASTSFSTVGLQNYPIPATISKITSEFIQVGQLRFVPVPIQTRVDWDRVNFLPYTTDIVNYAFIYNGQVKFWPIPSTTGNLIQFNYKARTPEFSTAFLFSDTSGSAYVAGQTVYTYQKGTVTPPAVGGTTVTGTSTAWNTTGKFPTGVDITYFNLFFKINQPNGDGIWYPISQFSSDTSLTLATPMQNQPSSASGATYEIGQMPILSEDFHDAIVYGRPLHVYFSTIAKDSDKFKMYDSLHQQSITQMESYLGTKQVSVDLEAEPVLTNPNNYPYAQP